MGDFIFNVAKGRVAELYNRVDSNDPANSALVVVVLKESGIESDATLKDYATLSTLLAAANDEATNEGYARKTLTDSDLGALTIDNANDRVDVDIPDQVFENVKETGGKWAKLLVCYDNDTTGGSDANLIPLTAHDCAVTPDGTTITVKIAEAGFYRAS
jgi:hypothetical protein